MTDKPKPTRQDLRGLANRTYIPKNSKRLEAEFGNVRDVTGPIRDEIERAYEQGYWDALEAAERERDALRGYPIKKELTDLLDNLERTGFELENVYVVDADSVPGSRQVLEIVTTLRIGLVFEKPEVALAQHRNEAEEE